MNTAQEIIKTLCERGIVSINLDSAMCQAKLAEDGIVVPPGTNEWIMLHRGSPKALFCFVGFRDLDDAKGGMRFVAYRFDFARYRDNPLQGLSMHEGSVLFAQAIADLGGFDLTKSTLDVPFSNEN